MPTFLDIRQSVYRNTPNVIGNTPNTGVDSVLSNIDQLFGELLEDRNVILSGNGTLSFTGATLNTSTTGSLVLNLNSLIGGGSPKQITILGNNSSIGFGSSGTIWYVTVNRTAGTATSNTGTSLPAVNSSNEEIFLIAVRLDDSTDSTQRLYFRSGFVMNGGDTLKLGASSGASAFDPNTILVDDVSGQVIVSNDGYVVVSG